MKISKFSVLLVAGFTIIALSVYSSHSGFLQKIASRDVYNLHESIKVRWSRVSSTAMEAISSYASDPEYWVVEDKLARTSLPAEYILKGSGFRNNHVADKKYNTYATSFGNAWNTKSIQIPNLKLQLPAEKVWTHVANVPFATQFHPIQFNDSLLINDSKNTLTKLNVVDGKVEWSHNFDTTVVSKRGAIIEKNELAKGGTVYVGADNFILAVDYVTGELITSFGDNGRAWIGGQTLIAPRLWQDKYLVSISVNAEIVILNKISGEILFKERIISSREPTRAGGLKSLYVGPRVWGGASLDNARNYLFFTTSNPAPQLVGVDRPGVNEYSSSVIAYDLLKKKIAWSVQDIRHDLWDYDIAAPPVLANLSSNEGIMDVVVSIGKSGNVYVLDRDNGTNVSDVLYRRAPTSRVSGEKTAPYQPYTMSPANLLGKYNTAVRTEQKWIKGYFDPPMIGDYIQLKGLHGAVIWPGFAVSNGKLLTGISNDVSLIGLVGPEETDLKIKECTSCHNGNIQPMISNYAGLHDKETLKKIITNGFQSMPSLTVQTDRLEEILTLMSRRGKLSQNAKVHPKDLVRAPYKKSDTQVSPAQTIFIDLNTGEILWKQQTFGEVDSGLALTGSIIVNDEFGIITGAKDQKMHILNLKDGSVLDTQSLEFIGSGNPTIVTHNAAVYIFVAETGSSTMSLYDETLKIGGHYSLYKIGDSAGPSE